MMKWIILLLLALVTVGGVGACKDSYRPGENVNISDVIQSDGVNASCSLSLYRNSVLNQSGVMVQSGLAYYYDAGRLDGGIYIGVINCTQGVNEFIGECKFSVEGDVDMIGFIFFIPLILGFFLLFGGVMMSGEEHPVLKWFLFLVSFPMFIVSLHFATISLVKFFDFPEMQVAIADFVYWSTVMWGVLVTYFIIYGIVVMVRQAAQDKEERLKY